MPGALYVVATPIGNLGDLSARAAGALEEADLIFCEDTRRARVLLEALALESQAKLVRLDAHARPAEIARAVSRIQEGARAVLLTDAGTPSVSDPGSVLVRAARAEGVAVLPIPGPSAVTALLSVAGLSDAAFLFRGFFPRKEKEQDTELSALEEMAAHAPVIVWFESPNRIRKSLERIAGRWPEAEIVVGKEMTKLHEKYFSGSAAEIARQIDEELTQEGERGEWCFLVCPPPAGAKDPKESWSKALICLLNAGVSPSQAARQVSEVYGVSRNPVYETALRFHSSAGGKK